MKITKYSFVLFLIFVALGVKAQVSTNFNNQTAIPIEGRFARSYKILIDFQKKSPRFLFPQSLESYS